jgi:outer membrane protein assembly factor BamB
MTVATLPRRRTHWWLLAVIGVLAAGAITTIRLQDIDPAFRNMWTYMAVVATGLLLTVWFMFFSGLPWHVRFAGLGTLVVLVAAAALTLRFEGVWGDIIPQFAWRWDPVHDTTLPDLSQEKSEPIRLETTPEDFPRFLGTAGRNRVEGVALARDWAKRPPRKLWDRDVGAGWGSFAIVGNYAFTQEQRGDAELVVCYELRTGKVCWAHRDKARFDEAMGGPGPRATPTVVDGKVYTMGASGILNCLDGATGQPLWSPAPNVLEDHKQENLQWAKSCSPLVLDELVVVTLGEQVADSQAKYRSLAAYDRKTGKLRWSGGRDRPSYNSPVLATLAGRPQIVVVNAGSVSAHDPADGRMLWEHSWPGEMAKVSQPVPVEGDRVFISAGYAVGCALLQVKAEEKDKLAVSEVWRNRRMKTRFTNVAVSNGYVYGLDDGILSCIDLAKGKLQWKDGRYGHGQVLLVDDVLLVQGEGGEMAMVEAGPKEFRELGRFAALESKTWNNPALSGPYLLVRNARRAVCYELPLR